MDYFIVDLVNKKITLFDNFTINDSFVKFFEDIKHIEIIKDKETHDKNIFITLSNDEVKIIKSTGDEFLDELVEAHVGNMIPFESAKEYGVPINFWKDGQIIFNF